jgi:hypothetical protein
VRQQPLGQPIGPLDLDIEYLQMGHAAIQQGLSDGASGASGPDQQDPVSGSLGKAPTQAFGEAPPVGVVTDPFSVPQNHGVDGAHGPGRVRQHIHVLDDLNLIGKCHIQPSKTAEFSRS